MSNSVQATPCTRCPLRPLPAFRNFSAEELRFVASFKIGEARFAPGQQILAETQSSSYLYTVLTGWAIKSKALDDGRRQIINYALPGDFLGLQSAVFDTMQHTIEALSAVVLCKFDKKRLWTLFEEHPGLAFDVTWLAANEKSILGDFLLSVGKRNATERIAFLLLVLFRRARAAGLVDSAGSVRFPFTQEHLADTVGFSLVHTNKSLGRLRRSGAFAWTGDEFTMMDEAALADLAGGSAGVDRERPFI